MIDKIYCINLPKRTDRREKCEKQFESMSLKVEFFEGILDDTPFIGFNKAMLGVITKAYEDGCNHALILEDDVILRHWDKLYPILTQLPEDYDLLYLGGNVTNDQPRYYSQNIYKALDIWTTHAVLYSRKMMKLIIDSFKVDDLIYDEWLRTKIQPKRKCFITKPFLAIQDVSWSDLWQCQADYSSTFIESEKKLR